ncbi:tetratricopeptide repeat protein [Polynucleobacter sp. MWH-Svant-W18]|uniref:tetratricopeptide repeat protein n=1 Tax=Polynucleobacter sp. MWH-Svant-W18 TaxID=1855909 RepID=UPI001BFD847E|nr:tetratricopeptide repeat protein [Polynucleobacter sp. MWH-Svant-W18]QWD78101.1 tetratricopeptide repeat protein [Polynucleobacter sp. MWH-Svant-W18]
MNKAAQNLELAKYWLKEGLIDSAKELLEEMIRVDSDNPQAYELLAKIYTHLNNDLAAIALLQKICDESSPPNILLMLGDLYLESGQTNRAINLYQQILSKHGPLFEALHNLGLAHASLFQYQTAEKYFEQACVIDPNSFEAQMNLGSCLNNLGEYGRSLKHLSRAQELDPDNSYIWLNKGVTFEAMNNPTEALTCFDRAIELNSQYVEAFTNKGNLLISLKRHTEAAQLFDKALQIAPDDKDTLYNQSLLQLALGDYERGWRNYENRWLRQNAPKRFFNDTPLLSSLDDLKNKRILIWSEQGLGDTLQFCRYLPALKELGAHFTLATQQPLIDLLSEQAYLDSVIAIDTKAPPNITHQIPLLSLPYLFSSSNFALPTFSPYLLSNVDKRIAWQKEMAGANKLKVGIVWNGGFRPNQPECWGVNARRNLPLAEIAKLQEVDEIQFFSLQKGEPAESELTQLRDALWPSDNLTILGDQLSNFSDTAALVDCLDLIICVDTSIAHLAGALGKPFWLLNRFDSCWRWQIDQNKTWWYPEAKIINQPKAGDWESVMNQVIAHLRTLAPSN